MTVPMRLIPFMNGNLQGIGTMYRHAWMVEGSDGQAIKMPITQGGLLGAGLGLVAGGPVGMAVGAAAGAAGARFALGPGDIEKLKLYLRYMMTRSNASKQKFESEVSKDDEEAIGTGLRIWMTLGVIMLAGAALSMAYHDDPEYEDVSDVTKWTHWRFKLYGEWIRLKRFEFGFPAIAAEAVYDLVAKKDPRLFDKMRAGLIATHSPPIVPQGVKLYNDMSSGINSFTQRPIVPETQAGRSPHLRYGTYTSEFSKVWAETLHGVGIEVSPAMIDYTLQTSLAYWGREIKVSSDYFFGRSHDSPALTDMPIVGTMWNRFTIDPSRQSASIDEFWKIMGHGKGNFSMALNDYDYYLKSGNGDAAKTFLAGMKPEERVYAVLQKHGTAADKQLHPLERAKTILKIDQDMRREMADNALINTSPAKKGEFIVVSPAKRVEVDRILGRLSAVEVWNALHDVGRRGWEQRDIRDPEPVLRELKASSQDAYDEMMRRRNDIFVGFGNSKKRTPIGDYAADREKWQTIEQNTIKLINDDNMMGIKWEQTARRRKAPTPKWQPPSSGPTIERREPVPDNRLPSFPSGGSIMMR
jgi:hypothetical protein